MILVIDNYDSFVHNLARYFRVLGASTKVVRNNQITIQEIIQLEPSHIVLSPGPCTPFEAGVCIDVVKAFAGTTPILGVCLGHQAIAQAFGGGVVRAPYPMHGKSSEIEHNGTGIFAGVPNHVTVGRYHSLVVSGHDLPSELRVSARSAHGVIMALSHDEYPVWGVQFHPESVLTEHGFDMIQNFLDCCTSSSDTTNCDNIRSSS